MEEEKKVFGYRMGESLYCPECYEENERRIPKDSGVKLPGKALTVDDSNGYFCNQCKRVKEAWSWKLKNQSPQKPSMEEQEKIVAYRIGQGLFCVDCYEKGARRLKEVQNPDESEVKFPSKAIKKGEIRIFICEECEMIKGDPKIESAQKRQKLETLREQRILDMELAVSDQFKKENLEEKSSRQGRFNPPKRLQKERDLTDLGDMVVDCSNKISFIGCFFIQKPANQEIEMSEDDRSGLYTILRDVEDDLDMVVDDLFEKIRKGLIIEKETA